MTGLTLAALGPGDAAPDFEFPAADVEGTVSLAEYRRRGPVLLTMLRGLYCPFCRRHVSQLRPTCGALGDAGIALLGVVIASPAFHLTAGLACARPSAGECRRYAEGRS